MSETERRVNLSDEINHLKEIINQHIALFDNHVEHFKAHEIEERRNYEQIDALFT
jgi:hypothetical protein